MSSGPPPPNSPAPRQRRRSSDALRERLIEAATLEFTEHGYEAASTRSIAARADAHQPQINYHFSSKEELWRACVDRIMADFDAAFDDVPTTTPRDAVVGTIRTLVHVLARRPELGRLLLLEGTHDSDRLQWIVEHHLAKRQAAMVQLWRRALDDGVVVEVDPALVNHVLIGAAAFLYTNASEARRLGLDPDDPDLVEEHADTLVRLFVRDPRPEGDGGGA